MYNEITSKYYIKNTSTLQWTLAAIEVRARVRIDHTQYMVEIILMRSKLTFFEPVESKISSSWYLYCILDATQNAYTAVQCEHDQCVSFQL